MPSIFNMLPIRYFDSNVPVMKSSLHSFIQLQGSQWICSGLDTDGYEEYSGVEYRSSGYSEQYNVTA